MSKAKDWRLLMAYEAGHTVVDCRLETPDRPKAPLVSVEGGGIFNHHSSIINQQSKGFTLLEVLIAVAIMSAIVTVIYASFSTASRNVRQAEEMRDSADLARVLLAKLSDDIANAYINMNMNVPAAVTILYGKKGEENPEEEKIRRDAISLTTLTNVRAPGTKETDLWEVGYFFKEKTEGSGFVLKRREKRELSKESPALEGDYVEYEVTDRVESLKFRYFDVGAQQWVDEWDSRTKVAANLYPKAVEITLALDDGSTYITEVEVGAVIR